MKPTRSIGLDGSHAAWRWPHSLVTRHLFEREVKVCRLPLSYPRRLASYATGIYHSPHRAFVSTARACIVEEVPDEPIACTSYEDQK